MNRSLQHRQQTTRSHHHRTDSQIGVAEVGNAVSARVPVLLRRLRGFDNAMLGALDGVVRPTHEEVGGIDDDGVFDWCGVDEGAVWRADLQAARHVLEEEGDGAWRVFWSA
jgi:hypothetical protein